MQGLFVLEILTPDKRVFKGNVQQTSMPGAKAPFTVLYNHAPLVSTLCAGDIKWKIGKEKQTMAVKSGFVEVRNNKVVACVEV